MPSGGKRIVPDNRLSDIQGGDAQRVLLDELPAGLDQVAHELGEDEVGVGAFLDLDLEPGAARKTEAQLGSSTTIGVPAWISRLCEVRIWRSCFFACPSIPLS